jgi:NADH-quinone oxidoreductase chain G
MTDPTISLTIDGQEVRCSKSCTIYEAASAAGVHIPTFCNHEKLVPVGACRMCLVEVEGARGLVTSCSTPVLDGMVVRVHTSPAAVKARKANIEFLLTNHPLDCPVCDKGGECPLQDQALQDGPGQSRYVEEKRHKNKRYPLGELIVLDQERCVLCWRCIRFLDDWAGDHELDLFGRGANTRLDTFPGRSLTSKWQGNTIDICPVGALTSRAFRFEARVWELTNTPGVCALCSVGCNITLGVKNNELRRITPRENMDVNDTWICDKGRFAHGFVGHPDRLRTPLIRREGELCPGTWDEALDLIAQRLGDVVKNSGPQAVGGLGSTHITNEANYLFQRFMRSVIGTNNVDHLDRMPSRATPLTSLPELEHKDVIVLLGLDPSTETPLLELWIKKAVLRHGAGVLVVNPRQIELARDGGPWLGYRPGSEAALLNGLARAILDANKESQAAATIGTRVTNLDEFREWLRDYGPRQVEQLTGASAGSLQQAARILAQARHPIILYGSNWLQGAPQGTGTIASNPGEHTLDAMENLAALLGGIEVGFVAEDCNTLGALKMGVVPGLYPGRQPFEDTKIRSRLAGMWSGRLSPVEGLDFDGMTRAGRQGNLEAMWIIGSDPADNAQGAGDALGRIPFLVVQDLFMTDTASMAEVVLPAASLAETGGSFMNVTGRIQAMDGAVRSPGEARPDWWIITQIAARMVDGKRRRAWDFSGPAEILAEITKVLPGYRGLDMASMGEAGWQRPRPEATVRRSLTRVEQVPSRPDPDYPLILVTGRTLYDRGTLLRRADCIRDLVSEAYVAIHPADAERFGLVDGDDASLVSAVGRLGLTVKVSTEVVPGVAYAPANLCEAPLGVLFANRSKLPRVRISK